VAVDTIIETRPSNNRLILNEIEHKRRINTLINNVWKN